MGVKAKVKVTAKADRKKPKQKPPLLADGGDASLPLGTLVLLSKAQIGMAIGVCVRSVEGMIAAGRFPPADVCVGTLPRWRVATYNAWVLGESGRSKE